MGNLDWRRWAPLSGIVYVILFVIAFAVSGDAGDTDEELLSFYADGGNRAGEIAGFFLISVGALFFLGFVNALRNRLRTVETEPRSLSALAFGSGVASTALLMAAAGLFVAASGTIEGSDEFVLDPNMARIFETGGYMVFVGSTMVASVLVLATSLLALKTAVLPTWVGWIGLVVAVILLFAFAFFPIFVLWLWILVVSGVMVARPGTIQPQVGAASN